MKEELKKKKHIPSRKTRLVECNLIFQGVKQLKYIPLPKISITHETQLPDSTLFLSFS